MLDPMATLVLAALSCLAVARVPTVGVAAREGDEGGLPRAAIVKVVQASAGSMQECYAAAFRKDRHLKGTITTRFVIARDGRVSSSTDISSPRFPDAKVAECVVAEFATLRFPEPDGPPVTVVYPILFSPD